MFKKLFIMLLVSFVFLFSDGAKAETQPTDKTIVYYFHGDMRCMTCNKMEQYTKESVESNFSKEIVAGTVEVKVLNTDNKENKHFLTDYSLYTKSVVLSKIENGKEAKFKNLDQIWNLVRDEPAFKSYIKNETTQFIKE